MNADYGVHGPSGKCEMIKEDECTFEACDEQLNGPRQCVGGPLALYVYRIKQKRKQIVTPTYCKSVPEILTSLVTSILEGPSTADTGDFKFASRRLGGLMVSLD